MRLIGLFFVGVALSVCSCGGMKPAVPADAGGAVSGGVGVGGVVVDSLRDCDLLFQASPSGNAITDVTRGACGLRIDHVGVFARVEGRPSVIEAVPGRGVCVTPIDSFMSRSVAADGIPLVVVGRVTGNVDIGKSLDGVRRFIGCRYDSLYLPGNREIYCSELVQMSFVDSNENLIFKPIPMTFRDASGRIPDYWTRFYARHGMPVPEGRDGTNPGEMSRRKNVRILMKFKRLEGMDKK